MLTMKHAGHSSTVQGGGKRRGVTFCPNCNSHSLDGKFLYRFETAQTALSQRPAKNTVAVGNSGTSKSHIAL